MPGGVCAVLDYEVDQMAEYVAEMAIRVVTPEAPVTSPFRKFVSQILTSTRLPRTTILLGMNYLAKRMNMLKQQAPHKVATEGQVWRYLTVALLLGSKFLDDNTFQNRSWSEVSGIAVGELNTLEFEWLSASNWGLFVNLEASADYNAWLANWQEWLQQKKMQQSQTSRDRLSSLVPAIDTELARYGGRSGYSAFVQQQAAEFERYQAMRKPEVVQQQQQQQQQQGYHGRDFTWHNGWQAAPVTPPDSGYGTPEYIDSATSLNAQYNDWFAHNMRYNPNANQFQRPTAQNGYYARPHGYQAPYHYGHHGLWEHGMPECTCSGCLSGAKSQQPYFVGHAYGQPVAG